MIIRTHFTRGQARRFAAWRRLIDAVEVNPYEHYWFTNGTLGTTAALVGDPYTTREDDPRTYWAERHNFATSSEEPRYDYRVYVWDGARIDYVGSHESATVAVGSAMFLAAV